MLNGRMQKDEKAKHETVKGRDSKREIEGREGVCEREGEREGKGGMEWVCV